MAYFFKVPLFWAILMLVACNNNNTIEKQKKHGYISYRDGNSFDTCYEIYSPILLDDTVFRDVWWQLKAPSLQNGRLSFYYKKPQNTDKPIECVSFGHNGLLLLHGAFTNGFHMSSGLIVQDREINNYPANYVFFGERGEGAIGYNWAEKSTNTDAHTRKVISFDSTGNVSILNKEGEFVTYGNDRYQYDVSDYYDDRSKIDMGFANRTYVKTDDVGSGVFSPYIKKIENVTDIKVETSGAHFTRIGNQVSVAMVLQITPGLSSKKTTFTVSLPIQSNFTSLVDCTGVINAALDANQYHGVQADVKSKCAIITFIPSTSKMMSSHINFTYTLM